MMDTTRIMTPHYQLYQVESKEHDDDHAQAYDNEEPIYHHIQHPFPAFAPPPTNFAMPTNPPAYPMSHPAAWPSDMNSMVFMDALQPWGPPQRMYGALNTNNTNTSRPLGMGLGWQQQQQQQQPSPLMAWDMVHPSPMHSPYPVQPADDSYERTVFKTEKSLEESWGTGWVEEMSPPLDATTTMHTAVTAAGTLPQAMVIDLPIQRPAQTPAHAPRKRRRVPSPPPMVDVPVFATPMTETAVQATEAPVPFAAQLPEQQHTGPPVTTGMFLEYGHVATEPPAPPAQHFQPHQDRRRTRVRDPTPTLEDMPEYIMMNSHPHPASSAAIPPQSPSIPAQFIGPVPAPRGPASKVRRGTNAVFKTQSVNSKRGHYASDVWEGHKAAIKKLYIDEGKPLREVINIMEHDHDFPATQRMYKARFKQWGFVKNNTEKVVSQILRTKFERDAAGKLSHFTRNGKDVNLQNYLQRKGLTEYDLVDFASGAEGNGEHSGESNDDSGNGNALLAHVRCRTPPTDVPGNLRLPDRLRFQDTLVMSFKRAFLLWRQEEQEKDFGQFQPSVFTWRVTDFPHLSSLIESARLIRRGDSTSGVAALNQAFWSMNGYLTSMDATASFYFFFHRQSRPWQDNARIALAVWKFLAAYASARNHNNHPLFHTFKLMYEVIQKEGVTGLRALLTESSNTVADELERAFGREHWLKDLIWHRCFPEKSKLRHLQLIRDLRDHGPTKKFVQRLY